MSHTFSVSVPKFHYYKAGQFLETFDSWPLQADGSPVISLRIRDRCVFVETVADEVYSKLLGARVVQWRFCNSQDTFQDVPPTILSADELLDEWLTEKIQVNFWQELSDVDEKLGITTNEIPDNDIWGTCAQDPESYPKAYTNEISRRRRIAKAAIPSLSHLLSLKSNFSAKVEDEKIDDEDDDEGAPLHYTDVPWDLCSQVSHKDFRTNNPQQMFAPDGMIRLVIKFDEPCTVEDFSMEVKGDHEEVSFLKNQQMLEVECHEAGPVKRVKKRKASAREEKKSQNGENIYVYNFLPLGEMWKMVVFIPVRKLEFGFELSTRHDIGHIPQAFIRWFHWPCKAKFASETCWIAQPQAVAAREATLSFRLATPSYPGKLLVQGHPTQNWYVDQCLMEYSEDGVDWFNHPIGVLKKEKKQILVDFKVYPGETYLELPSVGHAESLDEAIQFTKENKRKYFAWFHGNYPDEDRQNKVFAWSSKKQMGQQGDINQWETVPMCTSGIKWLNKIDIAKLIRQSSLYPEADVTYDDIVNAINEFLFFPGHTSFIVREEACIPFALNNSAIDQRQFIGKAKSLMEAKLLAQKHSKQYFTWYNPLVKPITEVSGLVFGWDRLAYEVQSWDRDDRAVSGSLWMNPRAPKAISDFCYLEVVDWGSDETLFWWKEHMPLQLEEVRPNLQDVLREQGFKGEDLINLTDSQLRKWKIADPELRARMMRRIDMLQPANAFSLVGSWVWSLQPPIRATYFRLRPLSYVGMPAMRIELLGVKGEGQTPLFSVDSDNVPTELVSQHPEILGEDDQVKFNWKYSNNTFCVDVGRILEMEMEVLRKTGDLIGQYSFLRSEKLEGQKTGGFLYTFTVANGSSEEVLDHLKAMGIGVNFGYITMVQIDWTLPEFDPKKVLMSTHVDQQKLKTTLEQKEYSEHGRIATVDRSQLKNYSCNLQCNLFQTVSHRSILIDSFVESVWGGAVITFDYVALCSVAALIAGGGLATDNVVAVIASMLVSPLMGPILAFTFGTWISDRKMIITGLVSELFGLLLCVFWGFVIGLMFLPARDYYNSDGMGGFPSGQMTSRGKWQGLLEGFLIAFPSGIGVAVSVMSENVASLVGVAISASLLPPAVNFGIYLALVIADDDIGADEALEGTISLLLTLENISLIYFTSLAVLYLKQFVVKSKSERQFWNYIDKRVQQDLLKNKLQKESLKTVEAAMVNTSHGADYDFTKAIYQTLGPQQISRSSTFTLSHDELKELNQKPGLRDVFNVNQSPAYLKSQQLYKAKTEYIFSMGPTGTENFKKTRRVNLEDVFATDLASADATDMTSLEIDSNPKISEKENGVRDSIEI